MRTVRIRAQVAIKTVRQYDFTIELKDKALLVFESSQLNNLARQAVSRDIGSDFRNVEVEDFEIVEVTDEPRAI